MRIVQWLAHSIEEYDQLRLLSEMGHEVFSPGAYIDPAHPSDDKRPPLDVPDVPEMRRVVDMLGQPNHPRHGRCDGSTAHENNVDACKTDTPDEIIEWADVLIVHHLEHTWLIPQWDRLRGRVRVIWRTVGQSGDRNEQLMAPLHREGVQILRYSPKERSIPHFAGEDALIRFYKDPAEFGPWEGDVKAVTNITQKLYQRSLADDGRLQQPGWQWTSYSFWEEATAGLPVMPAGPGSEVLPGGVGGLAFDSMLAHLRRLRAYCYTGTQPASYTLGLIEAMMTGIPVVSMLPSWFRILPYGPLLFEGHEIALLSGPPDKANAHLRDLLNDDAYAAAISEQTRHRAIELFGKERIRAQWDDFLSGRTVNESVPLEVMAA